MSRGMKWAFGGIVLLLIGAVLGCAQPLILLFQLLFGWVWFVARVVPRVSVPIQSAAVGLACLVLVVLIGHLMARWLWREMRPAGPPWRVRSTATVVGVVLLMFACGMAATGAAHQVGWLIRDPGPTWVMSHPAKRRYVCGYELRQIGITLSEYAYAHENRLPESLDVLTASVDGLTLQCPSQTGLPYVYYGRGQTWPLGEDVPVVAEPLANHEGDGMNILFGDGSVRFILATEANAVLARRP